MIRGITLITVNKKEKVKKLLKKQKEPEGKKKKKNLYSTHWKKPSGFFLNHVHAKAEGSQPRVSAPLTFI